MLITLILTFVLIVLAVSGLSLGVMLGRKPPQGSCGGLASLGEGETCRFCGGNPGKCEELNREAG